MTLNVIFVCKTNDVLAVRKAAADEQALDELKALPAEGKPHGVDRCVSPPTKKARLKTDYYNWRRGRDSNSGWDRSHDGFQDRCIKPLCHLSISTDFIWAISLNRNKAALCRRYWLLRYGCSLSRPSCCAAISRPLH